MIADGLGHFSPWCSWRAFLREVNGITMDAQELSEGVPGHLECLLVFLVPDDSPAKASIFSLADLFAGKPPQKLFGQGF